MKLLLIVVSTALATGAFAQEVSEILTEAQRAYLRNDTAVAKEKFELVRKLEPNNRIAVSYLRLIAAAEAKENAIKGPGNATETALKALIMPKVQFTESSLAESLEYLRQKGNQISGEKTPINFVMQIDDPTKARKITLSLSNVPFTEALRYIGDLAGVQFVYDRFAIVVKPKGPAPAVNAEPATAPPGGVKIEGL
jgi:hypothetical protein